MTIKFMKSAFIGAVMAVSTLGVAQVAMASDAGHKLEKQDWSFNGMFGTYDMESAQRGYQVYKEVCSSCHSLEHLAFRNLGDKGAPFYDVNFPNPNDNPNVKAFAADWSVEDIDQDSGDVIERPGIPADEFPDVFPNAIAAAASNGGAVPPDLSLITKARAGGADYVYALLTGYHEAPHGVDVAEGTYYNTAFSGNQIKMAPPLSDGMVEYDVRVMGGSEHIVATDADGFALEEGGKAHTVLAPEATTEQMARDVVEFLAWAGDPKMEVRKKLGFATFMYLFIFCLLLFMTYKQVWKGVKH